MSSAGILSVMNETTPAFSGAVPISADAGNSRERIGRVAPAARAHASRHFPSRFDRDSPLLRPARPPVQVPRCRLRSAGGGSANVLWSKVTSLNHIAPALERRHLFEQRGPPAIEHADSRSAHTSCAQKTHKNRKSRSCTSTFICGAACAPSTSTKVHHASAHSRSSRLIGSIGAERIRNVPHCQEFGPRSE